MHCDMLIIQDGVAIVENLNCCIFSAATIPVTTSCFEKKKFVDGRLVKFLLPVGTVTNAPGSAIYVAVAAMFIVQTFHPNLLSFTSCVLIW